MAKNYKPSREQIGHRSDKVQLCAVLSCDSIQSTASRSKDKRNPLKLVTRSHKYTVLISTFFSIYSDSFLTNTMLAV